MQQKNYQQEILALIHSGLPQAELAEKLSDYHENDLADALARSSMPFWAWITWPRSSPIWTTQNLT